MSDTHVTSSENKPTGIDIRNPYIAGLLAWLFPGLGHCYQARYHKAVIFFLCIVPTFIAGCALASNSEVGTARNVYWSWRWGRDMRLWTVVQAPLGIAAIPSGIQAWYVNTGSAPPFGTLMAPPCLYYGDKTGVSPVLNEIRKKTPYFELGTYLTAIAGLMNLLVIFDAIDGPFVGRRKEDEAT
jgi:hypothetical protein